MKELVVSEIFGPTIQGEGPNLGKRCAFLRLGGCNLHCVWCDTAYTWRFSEAFPHELDRVYEPKEELERLSQEDVFSRLMSLGVDRIVISGGEPLLQSKALSPLTRRLLEAWFAIEIETAGTIWDSSLYHPSIQFNVSPKLSHSGNDPSRALTPALEEFVREGFEHQNVAIKFVVQSIADFDEIESLCNQISIPSSMVWIMPEGRVQAEIDETLRHIAQEAILRGYNLTTRLHVHIWGNRRGV